MAGRAGSRGLLIGTVVVMCHDEIPGEKDLKNIIIGGAARLESQCRLTYIVIIHLLCVEEIEGTNRKYHYCVDAGNIIPLISFSYP